MDGTWHFNRALIIFKEPGLNEVSKLLFCYTNFWIQVHNVSVACMSERMGLKIGNLIGEVIELEGVAIGLCLGKFLCIRVRVDVSKPLLKAINVVIKNGEPPVTVFLSYERLPDFCLNYGTLNHILIECSRLPPSIKITPQTKWKYESWVRGQVLEGSTFSRLLEEKISRPHQLGNRRRPAPLLAKLRWFLEVNLLSLPMMKMRQ